jgi:hypothetical protein
MSRRVIEPTGQVLIPAVTFPVSVPASSTFGLLFYLEEVGCTFLENVGKFLTQSTA